MLASLWSLPGSLCAECQGSTGPGELGQTPGEGAAGSQGPAAAVSGVLRAAPGLKSSASSGNLGTGQFPRGSAEGGKGQSLSEVALTTPYVWGLGYEGGVFVVGSGVERHKMFLNTSCKTQTCSAKDDH